MPNTDPALLTLSQAQHQFLTDIHSHQSGQVAQAYQQATRIFLRYLRDTFHIQNPGNITDSMAQTFLAHLQSNFAIETEHLYSRAILSFIQYLETNTLTDIDAHLLRNYYTEHRRKRPHELPAVPRKAIDDLLTFVSQVSRPEHSDPDARVWLRFHRDRAFILMLANAGLRLSEACALKTRQFISATATLAIDDEISVELPQLLVSILTTYLQLRAKTTKSRQLLPDSELPLFARHDKRAGQHILALSRWTGANIVDDWTRKALPQDVRRALEQSRQSITPNSLRHYFVLATLEKTDDLTATQLLARHQDLYTTRQYAKLVTPVHEPSEPTAH